MDNTMAAILSSSPSSPTTPSTPNNQSNVLGIHPTSPNPVKMNSSSNTFVHKLYNMVVDKQYQHLIAWNYTGSSFIVCNIMEFSRDVLPKHFKHNNFSSFVRQLNMYGFHKVNKSPRGHRTLAENQIWEFSHPKFLRGRPDLLDDIKRKAMESETLRRETGDLHAQLAMMQVAQNDLMQQIQHLQQNFQEVLRELAETKRKQNLQQQWMKSMWEFMQSQGSAGQLPFDLNGVFEIKPEPERPQIYVSPPENHMSFNLMSSTNSQNHQITRPASPLTINTNLGTHSSQASPVHGSSPVHGTSVNRGLTINSTTYLGNVLSSHTAPLSPNSLSSFNTAVNTPLPPSVPGSPMPHGLSDDDMDGNSMFCTSPNPGGGGSYAGSDCGDEDLYDH